jgi:hypothetical protein
MRTASKVRCPVHKRCSLSLQYASPINTQPQCMQLPSNAPLPNQLPAYTTLESCVIANTMIVTLFHYFLPHGCVHPAIHIVAPTAVEAPGLPGQAVGAGAGQLGGHHSRGLEVKAGSPC